MSLLFHIGNFLEINFMLNETKQQIAFFNLSDKGKQTFRYC